MGNIRILKKNINNLIDELIDDCRVFIDHSTDNGKKEKALDIIQKAVDLHNQLLDRVNHPDGKDNSQLVKQHYTSIRKDLTVGVHELLKEMSDLAK